MKFVKMTYAVHDETYWVNTSRIVSIQPVSGDSGWISCVKMAKGLNIYDDRPPEALVAAIEEATK